jgi:cell division septation protein DedD
VQVGAFGEREKALALKKQLADEKLDLFIEVAGEKQKRVYRVKVGPMISHEKAEQMQLRLVDKFKLTAAFVSSYPRVEP